MARANDVILDSADFDGAIHYRGRADAFDLASSTKRLLADRPYLRRAAVHRLLRLKKIGRARAIELLAQHHSSKEMQIVRETARMWRVWSDAAA
jgi:hypothetical protein